MLFPLSLGLLALTQLSCAQYNASTITNSVQLNAAVSAIAASYFPSSILPSLAVAIGSASATGDPRLLISNLLTESTPPAFLSALPTPYQSRLQGAESKISSLRVAVDSVRARATITPGAAGNDTAGNVTEIAVIATASNGTTFPTTVPARIVNGSTITSGVTASATSAGGSSSSSAPASTPAAGGGSSSSSGFAVPTQVPVAAAGLVGVLGLLAAL